MLEFNIRNQEISRIDNFSPAEKSVEYLIAKFNFKTEDWNEAIKRAIFRNVKSKVEMDAMIEDDSCVVPWEVLEGSSDIEVSVHGVIGTEEITTDVAVFDLNRTLQGGSATQEPSPTVYAQMVEMVKDAKEVAQSVRDDADNGKFSGIPGAKGEDGKSAYDYAVEGGFKGTEQEFIDLMAQAGHVDLTGYVSKEQHEAELLKAMVKVTTDKAPFHHITDSANMKVLDFGMEGITEQETTPGNQLFDLANSNGFVSLYTGFSTEIDIENNTLTTTNSHTNKRTGYLDFGILEAGTYYLSYENVENAEAITISQGELVAENMPKAIKTISPTDGLLVIEETYHVWGLRSIPSNGAIKLKNIMLNKGSTALPIEKYVGGMPSPNPDHPQEIVNAGVLNEETGRYEIGCRFFCENIWNPTEEYTIKDGAYRIYKVKNDSTQKMQITLFDKNNGADVSSCYIGASNGLGSYVWSLTKGSVTYQKNTTTHDYICLFPPTDECLQKILNRYDVMVEYIYVNNEVDTEYVEPQSQPFTLTSDRPLTMWDKLVKRDGVWGWSVNSIIKTFDGSSDEGWEKAAGTRFITRKFTNVIQPATSNSHVGQVKCDSYIAKTIYYTTQSIQCIAISNGSEIYIGEPSCNSLDAFITQLSKKPIKVYCQTKEEQAFIPLPDEEQELLHNLETYYGVTNVYNEQGCPMWLTYVTDTKLYVDQKLLEIQQAII